MKLLKSLFLLAAVALLMTGCIKPPKVPDVKEIKPNETAWVIPLDAQTQAGQAKFNSVDFLNQKKVAAKRIWIDKTEKPIGRFSWEIEWVPSVRVITVDRTLITREWTDDNKQERSSADQGIHVNTKDNIKLIIGITITVSIEEDNASTYLYYHGERPLSDVTDQNIRSFVSKVLSEEVSALNLSEFQNQQVLIYADLSKRVTAEFVQKGITVQYVGNAKGWHFEDEKIQESINKSYIAQQDNKTAEMEQQAQQTRNATQILNQETANKIKVISAEAEANAAKELLAAKEAASFQNQLKVTLLTAEAKMQMATKWDGKMPANILPEGSPMLLNMGSSTNQ